MPRHCSSALNNRVTERYSVKARLINNQTPMGSRSRLADELPLATPYLFQVFPVYACNFKCNYCVLSLPKAQRGYISDSKFLDTRLYRKCIDDLAQFPEKLRMLRFAGTGEPLLHPDIAEMIAYAVHANIANSIDIVTNGALLTPDLSQRLVDAGTNRIRISIQGVTAEQYAKTTGTYSDIEKIINNLNHLYRIRGKTELYVKIIDSALESEADTDAFYRMFGDIADVIAIEHLLPASPLIDYTRIAGKATMQRTQNGACISTAEVCPQPFYMLQLNPDGMVAPCCGMESPMIVGHTIERPLVETWNGEELNQFRYQHLIGKRSHNPVCATCQQFRHAMFPEDILDLDNTRLKRYYQPPLEHTIQKAI
jgi:radical SAM protein with 4Fe4S-binding SPASM domain